MSKHLIHYGVLGMKWGVRTGGSGKSGGRSGGKRGSVGSRLSAHYRRSVDQKYGKASADSAAASKLKGRSLRSLSNDELKILTTRMQLERQYKSLKTQDISAGQKWVTDLLLSSGKEVAKGYVTGALGTATASAIDIFPKP